MQRKISLEETLHYAEEANRHARDQIRKGSSQLENNNLSEAYFDFLRRGVTDSRDIIKLQKLQEARKIHSNPLEKDPTVAVYESMIEVTSKYSIGNCYELAIQALDHILNNINTGINAEVYGIHGGDHFFLVLNRDQDSNPQDPKTWGESAVICDPWSNKVYKASDYLSQLKNFYREGRKNCIEDFDPSKHLLVQQENFNTNFLRYTRNVTNLKANFLDESRHVEKILVSYKGSLTTEEQRIRKKYGDNDERVLVISEKIKVIDASILSTIDFANSLLKREYKNDYRFAKAELMNGVGLLNNAVLTMQFSKEDQSKLFEHKGKDKKTEIMKFFGIKSEAHSFIEDLTKNVNKRLSKK